MSIFQDDMFHEGDFFQHGMNYFACSKIRLVCRQTTHDHVCGSFFNANLTGGCRCCSSFCAPARCIFKQTLPDYRLGGCIQCGLSDC